MKKIQIITLTLAIILSTLFYISCNKKIDNGIVPSKDASSLIMSALRDEKETDFEILVSSSLYCPSNGVADLDKSMVGVQCFSKNRLNCGKLKMNNIDIPFTSSNTYFLQSNTQLNYGLFVNNNASFNFVSNNSNEMGSFQIQKFIPKLAQVTYEGIPVNGGLNLNTNITVKWVPENNYLDNPIVVVVQGERDNSNEISTFSIIGKECDGKLVIPTASLQQIAGYNSAKIFFGRGFDEVQELNNKQVGISSVQFSWTKVRL